MNGKIFTVTFSKILLVKKLRTNHTEIIRGDKAQRSMAPGLVLLIPCQIFPVQFSYEAHRRSTG